MDVIVPSLLPFCLKEFINCWFQVSILNPGFVGGIRPKANLAAKFALSFPLTPMWLGIQHIIISFLFHIEFNLLNSLMIRGFSNFLFLNDSKTESENDKFLMFTLQDDVES